MDSPTLQRSSTEITYSSKFPAKSKRRVADPSMSVPYWNVMMDQRKPKSFGSAHTSQIQTRHCTSANESFLTWSTLYDPPEPVTVLAPTSGLSSNPATHADDVFSYSFQSGRTSSQDDSQYPDILPEYTTSDAACSIALPRTNSAALDLQGHITYHRCSEAGYELDNVNENNPDAIGIMKDGDSTELGWFTDRGVMSSSCTTNTDTFDDERGREFDFEPSYTYRTDMANSSSTSMEGFTPPLQTLHRHNEKLSSNELSDERGHASATINVLWEDCDIPLDTALPSPTAPVLWQDPARGTTIRNIKFGQRDTSKDALLLQCRDRNMSYKDIKEQFGFTEAESTLRGRYRTLSKPKEARVRKPEWSNTDVQILLQYVHKLARQEGISPLAFKRIDYLQVITSQQALKKVPWKRVAIGMEKHGGTYKYGNATVKKKYVEVCEEKLGYKLTDAVGLKS